MNSIWMIKECLSFVKFKFRDDNKIQSWSLDPIYKWNNRGRNFKCPENAKLDYD